MFRLPEGGAAPGNSWETLSCVPYNLVAVFKAHKESAMPDEFCIRRRVELTPSEHNSPALAEYTALNHWSCHCNTWWCNGQINTCGGMTAQPVSNHLLWWLPCHFPVAARVATLRLPWGRLSVRSRGGCFPAYPMACPCRWLLPIVWQQRPTFFHQ